MKTPSILWPAVSVLLVSAGSMALEIVAGRALAPYVGMSLYSWTMVIAVVLAGLSLGNWLGGVAADQTKRPRRLIAWCLMSAAVTTLISLSLLRTFAGISDGAAPLAQMAILSVSAFFAPSFFAGLLSPLLTILALNATSESSRGTVLGLMFALGAFGAIVGTLAAGLWLISWLGTSYSILAIAALYAAMAMTYLGNGPAGVVGSLAILISGGILAAPDAFGLSSPCERESSYFCIRSDDLSDVNRPVRVMALDHLAHSVNDRDDPRILWSSYVQGVDELVSQRMPRDEISAFFIGGGAYTLPRAWLERYPQGRFTVAEIDEEVTRFARDRLWFTPDDRIEIVHQDARMALKRLPKDQRFDVIFGDAFHDIAIPHHLATDEFHADIKARLNPDGVYVMNVVDALRSPLFMLSLAKTLKAQFAHVELWLDAESVQPFETRTTWIVLATDIAFATDRVQSSYGPLRTWLRIPLKEMRRAVGEEQLVFLTDDYTPVDRLLAAVSLRKEPSPSGP